LFFLFILGQYVARIYDETRGRPLYIVAEKVGFDEAKSNHIEPAKQPIPEPQPEP
jgi:dolichol-phosphate mannosyltransferase